MSDPGPVSPESQAALDELLRLLATDETAPSSVRDVGRARRVHVDDSLSGLEVPGLREARAIADVGAGAGFPGLPLAVALPGARVDLIESIGRQCDFLSRAIERARVANATVVCRRAEEWGAGEGRERYDAVAVRAVGRLATIAELASPLLRQRGVVVAWKGRRDAEEEAELERAAPRLAMEPLEVRWVGPYAGSRYRHLHVMRKAGPTPEDLPRRPGMAKKRPLGRR